jgi:NitT/TauT family transport system ATP-binding protein
MANSPVLELRQVNFGYSKGSSKNPVLENVSFSLQRGDSLAILGPSGVGKTTLARICSGLQSPDTGQVFHHGDPVVGPSSAITVSFQGYPCFPWLSVERNLLFGLRETRQLDASHKEYAQWLLQQVGLHHARAMYPRELSGGMLQRLSLARCLALQPDVLILDEPFSALDQTTKTVLIELILKLQPATGFTLLTILHDLKDAYSLVDRVVVLSGKPARSVLEMGVSGQDFLTFQKRVLEAMNGGRTVDFSDGILLSLLACIRSHEVPPRQLLTKALGQGSLAPVARRIGISDAPFVIELLRDRDSDRLRLGIMLAEGIISEPQVWEQLMALWHRSLSTQARLDLVDMLSRTTMPMERWIEQEAVSFLLEQWTSFVAQVSRETDKSRHYPGRPLADLLSRNTESPHNQLVVLRSLAEACVSGGPEEARAILSRFSLGDIPGAETLLNAVVSPNQSERL